MPASIPPPVPIPAPLSTFQRGEKLFEDKKYSAAARVYEEYLRRPDPKNHCTALFHLGISRILGGGGSPQGALEAEVAFKSVLTTFPNCPHRPEAEMILGLKAQIDRLKDDAKERDERIRQLTEELQKLKEIDLQRKPSRPPQ